VTKAFKASPEHSAAVASLERFDLTRSRLRLEKAFAYRLVLNTALGRWG